MRRLHTFLILSALVAIPIATPLQAQDTTTASSTRQLSALPALGVPNTGTSRTTGRSHPSFVRRVVTGLGLAVAGAWIGYLASETAHGDWHPVVNNQFQSGTRVNRGLWAGAGGAVGFALGFAFAVGPKHKAPGPLPALAPGLPMGRSMITAKEIASSQATTAYEAVQDLRPEWLPQRVSYLTSGSIVANADIPVYENSTRIGGLEELSKVRVQDVAAIYRLDSDQVMARFGAADPNGAILVVSKR